MTIMTTYFQIKDDFIQFFWLHKISTHRKFLPTFSIILLESEKFLENLPLWSCFSQAPPLIDYHGNNEWPIPKL